ncbi:hypothetical protein LOD99_14310 [Oopsacas minuta]|uniref:Uncharacterized protein n=1 Tax=Oopsacas minuta TaxID=111878 RepID=A0AAV7KGF3_9METZ|nr:hypothetical protein LOD99_14310 [Oopsacas minuta]
MPFRSINRISQLISEERIINPDYKQNNNSMFILTFLCKNLVVSEQPKSNRNRKRKSNCLSDEEIESCIYSRFSSQSSSQLGEFKSAAQLSLFSYKSVIHAPKVTVQSSTLMHKKKIRFQ